MFNDFNDDDFFINDDELAEDNQPSLIESAMLSLIGNIESSAKSIKENINFNEKSEISHNISILSSHIDHLIKLSSIEVSGLSEEEIYEEIENVMKSTTELTFSNINEILPDAEPVSEALIESSDDNDGTDW